MTQGLSGVRKRYQGVAEQPWGLGDPMVVQARTPFKLARQRAPDTTAGPRAISYNSFPPEPLTPQSFLATQS